MRLRMINAVLLCVCIVVMAANGGIGEEARRKLHPTFQKVVSQLEGLAKSGSGEISYPNGRRRNDGLMSVGAIIWTEDAEAVRRAGIHVNSELSKFVTAQLTANELEAVASLSTVSFVEPGRMYYPAMDVSLPETGANLLHAGFVNNTAYKGQGVIVLIYDTGIDWKHLDFRKLTDQTSRILYIWDQTLLATGGETAPAPFNYGVEYTKAQIDDELDGTPTGFVREQDINNHGTHVAGTAAGNGQSLTKSYIGVAPEADIIVVKGGDNGFATNDIINGLSYAQAKAVALGKAIVVNMSLGGQLGPHDGTNADELAINTFAGSAGQVAVLAAGNEGGDLIHRSGTVNTSSSVSFTVNVPSYTPQGGSSNDNVVLDVWLNGAQTITASVVSPNGVNYTGPGTSPTTTDGTIKIYNYIATENGDRNLALELIDESGTAPAAGTWTFTISNPSANADFDAWMGYSTMGATLSSGDNNKTVGMPGTADGAITVGSYVTKWSWPSWSGPNYLYGGSDRTSNISLFSGIGPTRDIRQKPDLAAPGQGIAASLSTFFDSTGYYVRVLPGRKHHLIQGTSMATPHVTGTIALMLQANPALTAAQVKSFLTATAESDGFTSSVPNYTWGSGKLDALEAVIKVLNNSASATRRTFAYDLSGTNQVVTLTGTTKYALRFTPNVSGRLTGIHINLTTQANNPIVGTGPLLCEVFSNAAGSVAGIPGTKIGSTVSHPFPQLSTGTYNYVDMLGANATVTALTEYHVVLSVLNPSDQIIIRTDDGTGSTNRSSVYNGSVWRNFSDASSGMGGLSSANIRVNATVTEISGLVSVPVASGNQPFSFSLDQNYPNPFNPSTTIEYSIPEKSLVKLKVFDILGREVTTLFDSEQGPGGYQIQWNGHDNRGFAVSSGAYFYRIETSSGYTATKMMMLVK